MSLPLNYKRKYALLIGKPPTEEKRIVQATVSNVRTITGTLEKRIKFKENQYSALAPLGVLDYRKDYNGVKISDLHIEVTVDKNSKSGNNNPCVIKIFNLSESTKNTICKKDNNIILKAGYGDVEDDSLPVIYTGQVESYRNDKQGHDVVTTLYCKDGYTPTTAVKVGVYWPSPKPPLRGNTYGDLIRYIATIWKDNGISSSPQTVITDLPANYVSSDLITPDDMILEGGYTFQGYLRQLTDLVASEVGYKWYIDNSILYFEPKFSQEKKSRYTFNLDLSQVLSFRDEGNFSRSRQDGEGFTLEVLLDGRFETGRYVNITQGDKKGLYKITQVSHSLSYRGNGWKTICSCEKVKV